MISMRWMTVTWFLVGAAGAGCAGSDGSGGTGCSGLSACCDTLSGAAAQACQQALSAQGVTDRECTAALGALQSGGACGGAQSGADGQVTSTGLPVDAGTDAVETGGSGSACGVLSACCGGLPYSQEPAVCLGVAGAASEAACGSALAAYQAAGYCSTGPRATGCYSMMALGGSSVCLYEASSVSACPTAGSFVSGSCPSGGLLGCCVRQASSGAVTTTTAECYYDGASVGYGMSTCASAGGAWSPTAP